MTEAHPTEGSSNLLENQVEELYRNSNVANLVLLAIALFLALILLPVADPEDLALWYGYTLVIALARVGMAQQYRKLKKKTFYDAHFWLNLHSAGVFLSGLGWGAVVLFIVPVEARFHLVSAIFVIAGLSTASAGSMASLKHGFAIFSVPALLPGALKLIYLNQADTALIGYFICAFLIFISMVALRIHEVILHSFNKQFESTKFVVEVQEIHEALVARYDDLERQLSASTKKIQELQTALEQKSGEHVIVAPETERKIKGDKFTYLLDKLHGGAWNYNLKTGEIRFSPQWLNMLGYKEDEIYPTMDFWSSLLHPDEQGEVVDKFRAHIKGKIPQYFSSHRLRARSGEWKWVFSRAQPVAWGTFGEVLDMVCVEIDIEDPETYLARKLTAVNFKASDWLHSETMFMQRLQYALQTTTIENIGHTLCHISVYSSDSAANEFLLPGNELSKQLAGILIRKCRHEDPVLDLGNNSFAVLLENFPIDKAMSKAASLQKTINAHQFDNNGQKFFVNTCIGMTPISDTKRSVSEIFEDAATACNVAFSDTPDSVFVFQRGNAELDSNSIEERIVAKMRGMLASKTLILSTASLKSMTLNNPTKLFWLTATLPGLKNHASALRLLHDSSGASSLATAFDLGALEMFHDWAQAQPKTYVELHNVYVYECKPVSILDDGFKAQLVELYSNNVLAAHKLCIGIPEALFAAQPDKVREFIDALKPAGLKFALTDFGALSFSFDYMKNLPVDYLELHDSLIANLDSDKTSLVTIKYLNEIGQVLNLRTIASCAGSETQEATLSKIGTHYVRSSSAESQSLGSTAGTSPASKPALLNDRGITH